MRYRPFLEKDGVRIIVNGKACLPKKLDLTERHGIDRVLPSGQRLYGWFGLMKESSQTGYYGFNTFRHGRMITCYDKIGFNPHATLARIVGELHMNHVPVTHDKRDFLRDSNQFIEVDTVMRVNPEFRAMQSGARRPQKWSKKSEPMTGKPGETDASKEESIGEVLQSVVRVRLEDRCPVCDAVLQGAPGLCSSCGSTTGIRNDENESDGSHDQLTPLVKVEVGERSFDVQHAFADLGSQGPMFSSEESSGITRITTNTHFPAYKATKDGRFYAALSICIGLALLVKEHERLASNQWLKTQERFLLSMPDIIRALQDFRQSGAIQNSVKTGRSSVVLSGTVNVS